MRLLIQRSIFCFIIAVVFPFVCQGASINVILDGPGGGDAVTKIVDISLVDGGSNTAKFIYDDCIMLSQSGQPNIPWNMFNIILPPDVMFSTVSTSIINAEYTTQEGTWSVKPVPASATWSDGQQIIVWPEGSNIVNGYDEDIYGIDALWPKADARLLNTGKLRKWRMVQLAIPLARYNPVSGVIEILQSCDVQITFQTEPGGGLSQAEQKDIISLSRIKKIALNYEQAKGAYEEDADRSTASSAEGSGYTIITTSEIVNTSSKLADFIAHKELTGFDVQVITEADFGGGIGDTAADNIRAWLSLHYLTDAIEYVLFIGNPDPSAAGVPMKMLWPRNNSGGSDIDSPSDFYYADLTGDWDLDGDGLFGEWPKRNGREGDFGDGGVDYYSEVIVGRIPYYGSIAATDAILEKIMNYERETAEAAQWRQSCLLPMEPSDDSTPGYHLGEQIKNNILTPNSWSYHRVYEETYGLVPVPESTPCNYTTVTNAWSGEPFGLVVWWTHGNTTVAADIMDLSHIPSLNDNYPTFTFQVSCLNAYPEVTNNIAYELLRHGAIGTVAATRVSWYYIGQTSFAGSPSNSGMSYEYSKRFVSDELDTGYSLHEMREALTPTSAEMWMNYTVFCIYGDPSGHTNLPEFVTLPLAGDFQPDGDVDLLDFSILSAAWETTPQRDNWDQRCDISDPADNIIDILDLVVFTENWMSSQSL